jgi:chemotaxis protein methyltransferase CheR
MTVLDMTAAERFRGAIGQRLGLQFDDSKLDFLAELLRTRLERRGGVVTDYLDRLVSDDAPEEISALAQELTVPETYFFRHVQQFRAFQDVVLPERLRASSHGPLRILSAGCASGDEAYSLAILLRDAGLDPSRRISIRAVDLNPTMIRRARAGRYSAWALRETPPALRDRWFRREGRDFLLDGAIRDEVTFEQRNLVVDDADLWLPASYDVIFCRNALMYLTPEKMRQVVARIARALAPGGYLFLGHAETLRGLSRAFALCHSHETFYYRRTGDSGAAQVPSAPRPVSAPVPPAPPSDGWIEAIGRAAGRIGKLAKAAPELAPAAEDAFPRAVRSARALFAQERFEEALAILDARKATRRDDPEVRLLHAVLLAHCGRFLEAEAACRAILAVDRHHAGSHYVLALCREKAGDPGAAARHDRAAIEADASFAMPRLHLGLLARQAGDIEAMRHDLGRALLLLRREQASRLALFGGGFRREALIALCETALRRGSTGR